MLNQIREMRESGGALRTAIGGNWVDQPEAEHGRGTDERLKRRQEECRDGDGREREEYNVSVFKYRLRSFL